MPNYKYQNVSKVDGGRAKTAREITKPKPNYADLPQVKDVKDIAKDYGQGLNVAKLFELIKGAFGVSVDIAEDGKSLSIHPDFTDAQVGDILVVNENADGDLVLGFDSLQDYIIPSLVPLEKVTHEISGANSLIKIDKSLFDANTHYEIIFEQEGSGIHYGFSNIVFPHDSDACFSTGFVNVGGEEKKYELTMASDGEVTIYLYGVVVAPESKDTKIYIRKVI